MGNNASGIESIDIKSDEIIESVFDEQSQETTIKKLEDILKRELERREQPKLKLDKSELHKSLLDAEKNNAMIEEDRHSKEVLNLSNIISDKEAEIENLKADVYDLSTSVDKWRRFYYEANDSKNLKRLDRPSQDMQNFYVNGIPVEQPTNSWYDKNRHIFC